MIDLEQIKREIEDAPRCVYNMRALVNNLRVNEGVRVLPSDRLSIETTATELERAAQFLTALIAEVERLTASVNCIHCDAERDHGTGRFCYDHRATS